MFTLFTVVIASFIALGVIALIVGAGVLTALAADIRKSDKAVFAKLAAAKLPVAVLGSAA